MPIKKSLPKGISKKPSKKAGAIQDRQGNEIVVWVGKIFVPGLTKVKGKSSDRLQGA